MNWTDEAVEAAYNTFYGSAEGHGTLRSLMRAALDAAIEAQRKSDQITIPDDEIEGLA